MTPSPRDHAHGLFTGHPRGLFFLAFTEAWERFSYYGMTALLVLYMVNEVLLPGHIENIAGFQGFRSAIEAVVGPLSTQALASQIFGLYTGFVYFTPLLGGLIADRWIGQRSAVAIGAVLMSAGHLAMAFDRSFLLALLLLVVGSGLLKGNIASQVGALYPVSDEARRSHAFALYSTGINFGSVAGPLLCGLLAQLYGWHVGFGAAAIFMLGGLGVYLYGYRHLPAKVARNTSTQVPLTSADWRVLSALLCILAILVCHFIAYTQLYNVFPLWIQEHVALQIGDFSVPIPWYQSIDPLFSILCVPPLLALWRRGAARGREPSDLQKMTTGAWLAMASNLLLVGAIVASDGAPVSQLWPFLYCVGHGVAFMYYWPPALALVSRTAPQSVNSTMMGVAYMTLFASGILVGWIGGFYERMSPAEFWGLHAAIGAAGGTLLLVFGSTLNRVLKG